MGGGIGAGTDAEQALIFLLQHQLRKRLLRLYVGARGKRSPKELTIPVNKSVSLVGYHVRVLAKHGAVEIVAEQPRRGAVEHFYRATPLIDDVPWARAALGLVSD
jgi:DNA-binding transcriptional ArsR family regulator